MTPHRALPAEHATMKHLLVAIALVLTVGAVTPPATGQSLSERMAEVRRKQGEANAKPRWKILQKLLYRKLTVDFDHTPARDAIEFIRTALGINLVARYSDDSVGYGIDPDLPVTVTVDDMVALDVLELVLEQCSVMEQCTWQLRHAYLEIGTKARLSVPAAREIRWVAIDELVFEAPDFDDAVDLRLENAFPGYGGYGGYGGGYSGGIFSSGGYGGSVRYSTPVGVPDTKQQRAQSLIEFITDLVEPDAWRRNGGTAASIYYRDGSLAVNAPDYIQRQIFGYPKIPPPEPAAPQAAPSRQP